MRIKKNIATSEEGFLFNPSTGDSFSTNSIGSEILKLLKKETSIKEIVDLLHEKYDADRITMERDLEDFLLQLKENNILD